MGASKFSKFVNSPIFWGIGLTGIFYSLLLTRIVQIEAVSHYFVSAEGEILSIPFVEILMFFIGFCALAFKLTEIRFQMSWITKQEASSETFFPKPETGFFSPENAREMTAKLNEIPEKVANGYFIQRLKASLDFIVRNGSAHGFSDEMKYLADLDAARMGQSYSFIRVIIWAIPILGFLGTVMGITLAIGGLGGNLSDTETTLPKMIADLSFAFDTTALALSFSIVLMFFQFFVEKLENRLLNCVDEQTNRELAGRFEEYSDSPEGIVRAVKAHGEELSGLLEQQMRRQSAIWEESFRNVEVEWTRRLESVGTMMADSLQAAFERAAEKMASQCCASIGMQISMELEKLLKNTITLQWMSHVAELKDVQKTLSEQCEVLHEAMRQNVEYFAQNNSILSQYSQKIVELGAAVELSVSKLEHVSSSTEKMANAGLQMSEAGEKIVKMENVLAQNLSTLQGARDFERTVAQLSSAVSILAQWLEEVKASRKQV
ncbi:MAG: MotA/TolQ/ExbB proton channel family protein [Thermoguttaceae bacterium]|nr:MotA/TolQ/ExbB proton channel family protein [Thermoguttaceae bacterium]